MSFIGPEFYMIKILQKLQLLTQCNEYIIFHDAFLPDSTLIFAGLISSFVPATPMRGVGNFAKIISESP